MDGGQLKGVLKKISSFVIRVSLRLWGKRYTNLEFSPAPQSPPFAHEKKGSPGVNGTCSRAHSKKGRKQSRSSWK